MTPVKPPVDGWHWKEWQAELAGTAVLLFAIATAKYWAIRGGPPWSDPATTIAIIAVTAGLAVLVVAVSPVRGLGPDLLAGTYPALWIYLVGPVAGSAVAAAVVLAWGRRPITGKLCHDPAIDCHMRCGLPHRVAGLG